MSEEAVEGLVVLLNPRRTRTNMKLLQLVWIFLLTLCGQSGVTAMMVKEDGEAILDCSFSTNIEDEPFSWKKDVGQSNEKDVFLYSDGKPDPGPEFKGRVSHFPDQLRFGNASIKITKAKTSDSGSYTCFHATVKKEIRSVISLTVGASPRPYVSHHKTDNGVLLRCEVLGSSPQPVVEWWDSDGNVLPADKPQIKPQPGNKFDVILNVTVVKAGFYRCVATQKEIYHRIYFETHVVVPGGTSEPSIANLGDTKDGVLLQCVVRRAPPKLQVFFRNSAGNKIPAKEPQKTQKGGGYDIILQTTVKKTDYYRCVTTEGKKNDEVHFETFVLSPWDPQIPRSSVSRLVPAAVVGFLGLVASVVV